MWFINTSENDWNCDNSTKCSRKATFFHNSLVSWQNQCHIFSHNLPNGITYWATYLGHLFWRFEGIFWRNSCQNLVVFSHIYSHLSSFFTYFWYCDIFLGDCLTKWRSFGNVWWKNVGLQWNTMVETTFFHILGVA